MKVALLLLAAFAVSLLYQSEAAKTIKGYRFIKKVKVADSAACSALCGKTATCTKTVWHKRTKKCDLYATDTSSNTNTNTNTNGGKNNGGKNNGGKNNGGKNNSGGSGGSTGGGSTGGNGGSGSGSGTAAFTLTTCADDSQWVYADGALLVSQEVNWTRATSVTVPAGTRVLAVKVQNTLYGAGWGATYSDGRVANAASWKCTAALPPANWNTAGFDDSAWTAPLSKNIPGGYCPNFNAPWLWTEQSYSALITIYCRTTLKPIAFTVTTCADDSQWVYGDGALLVSQEVNWTKATIAAVPVGTRVLAIKVNNSLYGAGWGMTFSNGRTASWKCTSATPPANWNTAGFDDSAWAAPLSKGIPGGYCPNFNAPWLWTEQSYSALITVYCRTVL